jgi:hypothetical protein
MDMPKGHSAVMNMRVEEQESLDDFPTAPWATRALLEHVLWPSAQADFGRMWAWEPACGRRIMSDVLAERFQKVIATDIVSYEDEHTLPPDLIDNYLDRPPPTRYQWMITNPPFNKAKEFVLKALGEAQCGVAVLCRTNWLESQDRYRDLFLPNPPTLVATFVERVPMIKGVWSPTASSATSYSWFVWDTERKAGPGSPWKTKLIPPCRKALTKTDDDIRYGVRGLRPWLEEQIKLTERHISMAPLSEIPKIKKRLGKLHERRVWLDSIGSTRHD